MDRRPLGIIKKGFNQDLNPGMRKDAINRKLRRLEKEQKKGLKTWPIKK